MAINNRKSLDPRWVKHNRSVIEGFMNCTVRVERKLPGNLVYDSTTKEYTSSYELIYEGPARLQPYGINFDIEVGLDPTARRLFLAQIKGVDLGVENDDRLTVVTTTNNQELLRYQFDVRGSAASSLTWATQLVCEADLKYGN